MIADLSPSVEKNFRHLVACAIADAKVQDVPALCRRLGLADGNDHEAMNNRYMYAQRRLADVQTERVLAIARELLVEDKRYMLAEQLAKIDEFSGPNITTLTRRRLIALFERRRLATEMDDIAFIQNVWPIVSLPAPERKIETSLEDYIMRLAALNDVLARRELLETLGLLTCSRAQLFKFLKAVASPEANDPTARALLAREIDEVLRHDGYSLFISGTAADNRGGGVADYLALLKPRVMSLVVFTALVGMVAAPGVLHPARAVIGLVCIAIGAGAAGALNMWYDADIDALMARTAARPIPRGRISQSEALTFGTILAVFAVITLGLLLNWVAGAILAFTIGFYIFVYTMWLKRLTPQNIVIGGAAGAFPPMLGWATVTGTVSIESIVLFLLIFLWTPPHFWALSLYRCRDYERAGVPMLPVVAGPDATRRQIMLYSVALVVAAFAPLAVGLGGIAYLAVSTLLNAMFLALAARVYHVREGRPADAAAKRLFQFSILYLFLLFAVLLIEHTIARLTA